MSYTNKTMRYRYTPIRMTKTQSNDNTKCWQDEERQKFLFIVEGNAE